MPFRVIALTAWSQLFIDPDAVLAGPVTLQGLEPVAGRRTQERQRFRGVELRELAGSHAGDAPESPRSAGLEQGPRVRAAKAPDHGGSV
jgi:hypothetical protein